MIRSIVLCIVRAFLLVTIITGCSRESKKARFLVRADGYYKAAEYEKAKIEYLNALRLDRQNAVAIERLGLIWFDQGAPLRALPFLNETRKLAPGDLDARMKLALTYASLGGMAEARKEAMAILQQSPGYPEALQLLDETSRSPEQIEEAGQYLHKTPDKNSASYHTAAGGLSLRKNDLATATREANNALQVDPKSFSAHSLMATLDLLQGKKTEASEELKAAAELAPARSPVRLEYAEFEMQAGAADQAKTVLKAITGEAPDYLPAWNLAAKIAFTEKKYDETLAMVQNVLGEDSGNLDGSTLRCQAWLAKGELKKALDGLEQLNKTYSKAPAVKYQLALAYLQNKDQEQAITQLTQAASINPDDVQVDLLLAELNLGKGDAAAVVPAMSGLLKKRPDVVGAKVLLADAYKSLNRLDDAAALIREEIQRDPKNPQFCLLLGVILRQQNKYDEARKTLQRGLDLAPDDIRFVYQLVDLDLLQGQFEPALERARAQLTKTPGSESAQFLLARVFVAQKKWDDAESALLKTLEIDPNSSSAFDLLISTYLATNKLDLALGQIQGTLAKYPNNPRALTLAALVYEKKQDYEKARDAYEKYIALTPNSARALNNLACLDTDHLNQLDKAYELAQKARTLLPADPLIEDTLGWIRYKRREYPEALALLQEAAGRVPGNAEIEYHLGMAGYMMDQTEAARIAFQRAASAQIEPSAKAEGQRRLALLESGSTTGAQSVSALETVVGQHPDDVIAWIRLGGSYEQEKAFTKAVEAYSRALTLNPKLVSAMAGLAELYAGPLQDKQKALEFAKKVRNLAPDDPATDALLGRVAYEAGDSPWAYSLLLQATASKLANDPQVQLDFAWAAYSLGKIDEARQATERVLNLAPSASEAENAKSFLAMTSLGDDPKALDAAEPEIEKLLAEDPHNAPALMAQAAIDMQRGKSKEAAGIYNEVLRQFPDFAPAQKQLAIVYAADPENQSRAYDLAVSARKKLPDDPELAQLLAELCYGRKEFARAIQFAQASASVRPLDAKSLYYLGMSYSEAKQRSEAQEALSRALAAGLQEPLAADAKRVVAGLEKNQ